MEQNSLANILIEASKRLLNIDLNYEDMNPVLAISQIQTYKKGETILGIGEKYINTGVVLSGIVRSYYLDINGNEFTRNFHKEGLMIMDEGLIGYEESICAYESLENSIILMANTKKVKEVLMSNGKLKDLYIASVESGMRYKIRRESEFLTNNATERYLQFKAEYPELVDRVKQSYISTYLGIAPESLSRIRKALKESSKENGEYI